MHVFGPRHASVCRPKEAQTCTTDLLDYKFSFKACIFRLIILLSCSGCCLSSLFDCFLFLGRHQRFEKAFLLAVDLEARDLFMVSRKKISFYVLP